MKLTDVIKPGRIIFRGRTYTPDEVRANIDDLARHLSTILPPDKPFVYLSGVNHAKFIFAYFAIIKAGRICVIVDPKTGPIEYGEYLEKVSPAAVIKINCDTMEWDLVGEIKIRDNGAEYTDELDDVCTMIFHAADDGYAKALMLTNRSLWADAEAGARANGSTEANLFCALIPFCALFGIAVGILTPFVTGAGIRIASPLQRTTEASADAERVTDLFTTPAVTHFLLKNDKSKSIFAPDAQVTSGGLPLPMRQFEEFQDRFGIPIRQGYGLSEASPVCTWNRPGLAIRPESVGTPYSCTKVKVVGEDGNIVPARKHGTILVCGQNLFKGYYRELSSTQKVLSNGWFDTRDMGYLDEDGYLYLLKNCRRMLNAMGTKVFPSEIERLVRMNSNVEDLFVFGVWRGTAGHSIYAEVRLKQSDNGAINKLKVWCARSISKFKTPKFVIAEPGKQLGG